MRLTEPKRPGQSAGKDLQQQWKWAWQTAEQMNMVLAQLEENQVLDLQSDVSSGPTMKQQVTALQQQTQTIGQNVKQLQSRSYTQQTSGIWTYRKWEDGTAECWGTQAFTPDIQSKAWEVYYNETPCSCAYPAGLFLAEPTCQVTAHSAYAIWMACPGGGSSAQTPGLKFYRFAAAAAVPVRVDYYAIGTWK